MHRMVRSGDLRLATQAFGRPSDPPVLLIMGATASMLGWPDGFCHALATAGHFVIRFDHRDSGHSTTRPPGAADYDVEDMAGDALSILDAFGLVQAHLVGMSLGGYIGQMLAVAHPGRVESLTLIASEPLGWDGPPLPGIAPQVLQHFGGLGVLDWADAQAVTAFLVTLDRLCATPDSFDEAGAEARARQVLARTHSPASQFNHATLGTRQDWTGRFRQIACPVLVLHGDCDPVLPAANGMALAAGIPGAVCQVLQDCGHEIPARVWPQIVRAISVLIARD